MLSLPTVPELIDSLDNELMDLLYERLKLAAYVQVPSTPTEINQAVQRMRGIAAVYHVPPEVGEAMALALIEAQKQWKGK
ncbi:MULTISPECIES: hypothetical protein [unclassified Cupriavidus]|uniref:hypothetical protein n=1 Tax=unclassified Cupriavidus TaxID=2640874 RepID=UPI001AE5ECF0|nr:MULTISPECIES: hypothetical protein [unclassified Cupriavidus]MBP0629943.1 hypothetical protein [Cupriavidus sp. AcVe19-1a]MBP0634662.1 hypothetical protein [Cupriavidus sp. AcVe19-6a]